MTTPAPHGTATQYQQRQQQEWSKFRARVPIDFYGVRAYNPGDPVPVSAVIVGEQPENPAQWIRSEWVAEVDAEQGQTFEGSATVVSPEQPTIDPATVAAPPGSAAAAPPDESSPDGSTVTSSED